MQHAFPRGSPGFNSRRARVQRPPAAPASLCRSPVAVSEPTREIPQWKPRIILSSKVCITYRIDDPGGDVGSRILHHLRSPAEAQGL